MRNLSAMALGLMVMGLGLFGAAAATPVAFPAAFNAQGHTTFPVALFVMVTITIVSTMFAGWLTARIATDHRVGHALMMASLGLGSAVFVGAIRWAAAPAWYYVVTWALIPPVAAFGALAWERTLRRHGRDLTPRVAIG